ncbi:type II secretion system F family protein [bacterium]|nr:type II secretion system F family protein [bacterium]
MSVCLFTVRNNSGAKVSGAVDAINEESAAQQLLSGGIYPTSIHRKKQESDEEGISFSLTRKKVTPEDLIILTRQLYSLTKAGVPLNKAIHGLTVTLRNRTLVEALVDVERNLNSGVTLSAAMSRHVEVFPRIYVSMLHVGENTGQLDQSLKHLIEHLELEKDTQRRIAAAFRYPMFVAIALIIAMVVLNLFVIPVFADLFEQFDSDLPVLTQVLIGTSSFFQHYWLLLLITAIVSGITFKYWINREIGRLQWDTLKLRVPLVGSIMLRAVLARFCRTFAMMLSAGVPLIQAVELSAGALGNAAIGERVRGMRRGIERGESLLQSIGGSSLFKPLVLQMIAVGEQTGQVDDMLNEVADYYNMEVDYDIRNLSSNIEPILIVVMAAMVGVLALGIFLPMWEMFGVVQN